MKKQFTWLGFMKALTLLSMFISYVATAQTIMFDDFNYADVNDAQISSFNKWSIVDGVNGPPTNAQYSKNNIKFIDDPNLAGNKLMTLSTTVNGQSKATTHSRIETQGYEYFEGTYAARVYFDETPYTYKDANIQTFYTIVSYVLGGDGSKYSELDFEYMAADKWGTSTDKQVMYMTAWNRYIADPWQAWKNYFTSTKSWVGWHTCIVSCTDKVNVKFWIDGQYFGQMSKTDNDGTSVYPRNPMQVAFANWIWNNVVGPSTTNRTTTMEVDWTLFYKDQERTPQQVDAQVASFRAQGIQRRNLAGQEYKVAVNNFKLDGSASIANKCVTINGMYVDGLNAKLGNITEENKILQFAKNNGFNYLLIYELNRIMLTTTKQNQLAAFIKRAKTEYDIDQIAAIVESAIGIQDFVTFNTSRAANERFDVFNLEFEFWQSDAKLADLGYCDYLTNYGTCNRTNAFRFYIDQIKALEAAATPINVETEVYIGWPTEAEATAIANEVDRVLVHYYRTNDINLMAYGQERLRGLAAGNKKIRVAPIFSSEGPGNTADEPFMGDWLITNPIDKAFESWDSQFNALTDAWKSNVEVMGATWFTYGRFIQNQSNHISTQPTNVAACIGTTRSFTVASSRTTKKYYWTKNGACLSDGGNISGSKTATLTISNISNADAGNYSCRVISYDVANPGSFATNTVTLSITTNCNPVQSPYNANAVNIPGLIECEEYDLGGEGVAYHEVNPARQGDNTTFRSSDGVDIENCTEGGFNLGYVDPTEWLEYTVNCTNSASYLAAFRVACNASGATCHLEIDDINVTGPVSIPVSGGWQTWVTHLSSPFTVSAGTHIVKLVMDAGNANFNNIHIDLPTAISNDIDSKTELFVYPNPSVETGIFFINTPFKKAIIYNAQGIVIEELTDTNRVDLSNQPNGMYLLLSGGRTITLMKQ